MDRFLLEIWGYRRLRKGVYDNQQCILECFRYTHPAEALERARELEAMTAEGSNEPLYANVVVIVAPR